MRVFGVTGWKNCGKTGLMERVVREMIARGLRVATVKHAHHGMDVDQPGRDSFRHREAAMLAECSEREHVLLATGAGAILDADSRRLLRQRGFVVWLQASVDQQLKRLQYDRARPLLAGVDRHERLNAMAAQRDPLYAEIAELTIPGHTERTQRAFNRCRTRIDEHWQRLGIATS